MRGYELSLRKSDALHIGIGDGVPPKNKKASSCTQYERRPLDPETLRRMRQAHEHELDKHVLPYDRHIHDRRKNEHSTRRQSQQRQNDTV